MNMPGKFRRAPFRVDWTRVRVTALLVLAISATADTQELTFPGTQATRSTASGESSACNFAVALGTPGSRIISAQHPDTYVNIMATRYWDLEYTLAGNRQTGVPLVAMSEKVLGPSGGPDDVGSYYLIPKLSILLGLPIARGIDFFYGIFLLLGLLAGAGGFLVLYQTWRARGIALFGLLLLTVIAYKIGDVYIFHFVTAVIAVPWMLVLLRQANEGFRLPVFLVLMGILIGTANAVRSHAGTAALLFLCGIVVFHVSASRSRKLALVLCLGAGLLLPKFFFERAVAHRNSFLNARCPEYKSLSAQHPLWHAVYVGFGYLQNDYGIRWNDVASYKKVQSVAPGTIYGSKDYELILRHEVFLLVRQHPFFVFMTVASKAGVILTFILLFANVGILAAIAYAKPLAIELSFWVAIAFSSLFGLLVTPLPGYLLGLISFATLYGVVSLGFCLEAPAEKRSGQRWIRWQQYSVDSDLASSRH